MGFKGNALEGILHQDVSRGGSMVMSKGVVLHRGVSRGECPKGVSYIESVQREFNGNVLRGVSYIRLCPKGVQW